MKKCPFCAEEIQDAAIVCKHCGRDLMPAKPAPKPKPRVGAIVLAVGVLLAIGIWILSSAAEQQRATQAPPLSAAAPLAPADIPELLAITIDRYGQPDEDYSAEREIPRPPMVLRMLSYRSEHVQLVYMPANYTFNMPPPYTNGWVLVRAIDPVTSKAISSQEAARRLAGRVH